LLHKVDMSNEMNMPARVKAEPLKIYDLYHGTTGRAAKGIRQNGFDSSSEGELGPGIYMVDKANVEKAKRFAHDATFRAGERAGFDKPVLIRCEVQLEESKFFKSKVQNQEWAKEGYHACRAERTTKSQSPEWCIALRQSIRVVDVEDLDDCPWGGDNCPYETKNAKCPGSPWGGSCPCKETTPQKPMVAREKTPEEKEKEAAEQKSLGCAILTWGSSIYVILLITTTWNLMDCIHEDGMYSGHDGGAGCYAWHSIWILPVVVLSVCCICFPWIPLSVMAAINDHPPGLVCLNWTAITINLLTQVGTAWAIQDCVHCEGIWQWAQDIDGVEGCYWESKAHKGGCFWWHLLWTIAAALTASCYGCYCCASC